jgi:hypothetical protein
MREPAAEHVVTGHPDRRLRAGRGIPDRGPREGVVGVGLSGVVTDRVVRPLGPAARPR